MGMVAVGTADETQDQDIEKDRQRILGTWRVIGLVVNGEQAGDEDARKLKVVNGIDGSWSLRSEENDVSSGTSTIDPSQTPKTIDFTVTEGDGKGISSWEFTNWERRPGGSASFKRERSGPQSSLRLPAVNAF